MNTLSNEELISAWLDGVETEEQERLLEEKLAQDFYFAREFAFYVSCHRHLREEYLQSMGQECDIEEAAPDTATTQCIVQTQFSGCNTSTRAANEPRNSSSNAQIKAGHSTQASSIHLEKIAPVAESAWPWKGTFRLAMAVMISSFLLGPIVLGPIVREWFISPVPNSQAVVENEAGNDVTLPVLLPTTADSQVGWVSQSVNVKWTTAARRWSVGDALSRGDLVHLSDGNIELKLKSGVVTTLVGPAKLEIQSASVVSLHYGTSTTRVNGPEGRGFRVLTPATEVVDLGTEFGVRVDPDGVTDVVVFEGVVDFTSSPESSGTHTTTATQRLLIGEAARVRKTGGWERLSSIQDDAFPSGNRIFPVSRNRPPIIAGVTDDRPDQDRPKFYRIYHQALDEDTRAYVDRVHEWNSIKNYGFPPFLRGADYVATFNDDKRRHVSVTVHLSQPAMLYLLYDDHRVVPDWLPDTFRKTGYKIGLDEGPSPNQPAPIIGHGPGVSIDMKYTVWEKRVEQAGPVTLGPVVWERGGRRGAMYGIAAQPIE